MFDKSKETQDNINETAKEAGELIKDTRRAVQKVKAHFVRNKNRYLVGGGIVVGTGVVSGTTFLLTRRFGMPVISVPVDYDARSTIGDVAESATVIVDQSLTVHQQFGGYCVKIVQDADDPTKLWPRIQDFCEEIAKERDIDPDQVRRMVNRYWRGDIADVFGRHPQRYGVSTTG